jgi:hypothetical protein
MFQEYRIKQLLKALEQKTPTFEGLNLKRIRSYERLIQEMTPEEPNPDDVLKDLGYYDSSDKRSCCRRKME